MCYRLQTNISTELYNQNHLEDMDKRLAPKLPELVEEYQTWFIKERSILDGIVITHETIHHMKKEKNKGLLLKLDFEKTYDIVN